VSEQIVDRLAGMGTVPLSGFDHADETTGPKTPD
jgi:hypothetical protein